MKKDPLIGQRLANFQVERTLGRGGMAQVYYGMDTQLDRPVAIKVIDARYQGDPDFARRFVDEARLVARWRHEHIVQVYYAGNEADTYFFAMEYLDGASLEALMEQYLQEGSLMPHEEVLRIGRAIASALDYAHKQGVVHRDIKPSNIMISRDERVVLMDFGLALDMGQGSMGQIFGTPHYISPEQARKSSAAIPQSDIYSLGVVLYELLTGSVPFDDPSAASIAVQHITMPPPSPTLLNPALNQEIEDVLLKALAKEAEERYSNAKALLEDLAFAIASLDQAATDSLTMLPPAFTRGQVRLSRKSISEMLENDTGMDTADLSHLLETQETAIVPKLTRPAKQAKTTEFKGIVEKALVDTETEAAPRSSKSRGLMLALGTFLIIFLAGIVLFLMMSRTDEASLVEDTVGTATAFSSSPSAASSGIPPTATASLEQASPEPSEDGDATGTSLAAASFASSSAATATSVVLTNEAILLANTSVAATNQAVETANAQANSAATSMALTNQAVLASTSTAAANNASQTANAMPSATSIPQGLATVPAYPNGALLELSYNSAGFYLRNSSEETLRLSPLRFQALDANGSPVGNAFEGIDWTRFYNSVDRNGRCVAIELLDQSSWTRPNNCVAASGSAFNAQLTFPTNDQRIFWDGRGGATQFAVFWDGQEIERCATIEGFCLVRVGTNQGQSLPATSIPTANIAPTAALNATGPLIEMSYNSAGFYLRNNSDASIRLSPFRFQALDASGNPLGNSFEGIDWTRFYNSVDRNGHCVAIELLDQASWTRPNNCVAASGSAFNSLLTFQTSDPRIFWDGRNGTVQFAVFWNEAEIGRCAIADAFCALHTGE